jgi:hypothetical protein
MENQVDGGGWGTSWPVGPVSVINTVEIRGNISGSLYPVFLTLSHDGENNGAGGESPNSPDIQINAAGAYEEWELDAPVIAGTYAARMTTKDAAGGNTLKSEAQNIQWT